MAHFAKLGIGNLVEDVLVVDNDVLNDGSDVENEQLGIDYLTNLTGHSLWKQTSRSASFRGIFAHIGGRYDEDHNKFVPQQPYLSWVFNTTEWVWLPPVDEPSDADTVDYRWDEVLRQWVQVDDRSGD